MLDICVTFIEPLTFLGGVVWTSNVFSFPYLRFVIGNRKEGEMKGWGLAVADESRQEGEGEESPDLHEIRLPSIVRSFVVALPYL